MLRHAYLYVCLYSAHILIPAWAQESSGSSIASTAATSTDLVEASSSATAVPSTLLASATSLPLSTSSVLGLSTLSTSTRSTTSSTGSQTATSLSSTSDSSNSSISDLTLSIILGACIGGIALLSMLIILWCALHRNRNEWRTPTCSRTPSPFGFVGTEKKPMNGIIARTLTSSRSDNAPEVLHRADSASSRRQKRLSALQMYPPDGSDAALAKIDENPQPTPTLPRSQHSSHRPSVDVPPSRSSFSKYNARSVDVIDAAARYSTDGGPVPHRQSVSPSARYRASVELKTPISPYASGMLESNNSSQSFKPSEEAGRSAELPDAPSVPSKNTRRMSAPKVHYPSWSEVQDFDFDEFDGQRGRRERPSLAMARRSGSWKPDKVAGRHELA